MSLIFSELAVGWKVLLVVSVSTMVYSMASHSFLRYVNRLWVTTFSMLCVGLGLASCYWGSKHLPTNAEFWTTWTFPDDVAVVLLTYGATMLIRLVQYQVEERRSR